MTNKVREKRIERLMSQEELAKKAGVSRQTIIAIESGRCRHTSALTLAKIAKALCCPMGEIFIYHE